METEEGEGSVVVTEERGRSEVATEEREAIEERGATEGRTEEIEAGGIAVEVEEGSSNSNITTRVGHLEQVRVLYLECDQILYTC